MPNEQCVAQGLMCTLTPGVAHCPQFATTGSRHNDRLLWKPGLLETLFLDHTKSRNGKIPCQGISLSPYFLAYSAFAIYLFLL